MNIFDELIEKTEALLPGTGMVREDLPEPSQFEGRRGELILGREQAYELGGSGFSCTSCTMYTEREDLVPRDQVVIYGKDLWELEKDAPFARIALIRTDDVEEKGEQGAYAILESIGLKKYDVFPKGYMVRTSALSNREQVRISKTAVKEKCSFADVGSLYISQYKTNKHVQAVKLIFVTLPDVNYRELDRMGTLSTQLFRALNHALADIKMDCHHCEWKIVCDEVEGMKELHQKLVNQTH